MILKFQHLLTCLDNLMMTYMIYNLWVFPQNLILNIGLYSGYYQPLDWFWWLGQLIATGPWGGCRRMAVRIYLSVRLSVWPLVWPSERPTLWATVRRSVRLSVRPIDGLPDWIANFCKSEVSPGRNFCLNDNCSHDSSKNLRVHYKP